MNPGPQFTVDVCYINKQIVHVLFYAVTKDKTERLGLSMIALVVVDAMLIDISYLPSFGRVGHNNLCFYIGLSHDIVHLNVALLLRLELFTVLPFPGKVDT